MHDILFSFSPDERLLHHTCKYSATILYFPLSHRHMLFFCVPFSAKNVITKHKGLAKTIRANELIFDQFQQHQQVPYIILTWNLKKTKTY